MPRMDMPEGANIPVPGQYSLVQAPLSNKGNPTSQGFNNLMLVEQSQPVRIVDKSGEVLFEGIGPEAAQQAVVIGKGLSDTLGKKAGWDIQTVPVGTSDFKTIANEKVNKSALGVIADIGLPILASALIPGGGLLGTILPAAAGSAASSVAQGRSLEDTLLRAAIAGGGAGLGESIFGAGIPSGTGDVVAPTASLAADVLPNLPSLLDEIAATAAQNVASAGLGAVAPAIVPSIAGDIVATAIKSGAPSVAGSAIGSTVASALPSIVTPEIIVQAQPQSAPVFEAAPETVPLANILDLINSPSFQETLQQEAPSTNQEELVVTAQPQLPSPPVPTPIYEAPISAPLNEIIVNAEPQTIPQPIAAPVVISPETPSANPSSLIDEIIVQAQPQTQTQITPPLVIPPVTSPVTSPNLLDEIIVTAQPQTPPQVPTPVIIPPTILTAPPAPMPEPMPAPTPDEITVTARPETPVITPPIIPPMIQPGAPAVNPSTTTTTPDERSLLDKLTANMGLADYLAAAGLIGSGVSSLFGNGAGGAASTRPYISPFGPMAAGFGAGIDYRAQPNITDYERYGFGPEATFFRPEYNRLVSGASAGSSAPAAAATPIYQPLI